MKEETRVDGPWEFGAIPKGSGTRSDLIALRDAIKRGATDKELVEDHFGNCLRYSRGITFCRHALLDLNKPREGPVECHLLYGPAGHGKTAFCKQKWPLAYPKAAGKWWDGYQGEPQVLFDDFNGKWFEWTTLMRILEPSGLPTTVEIKGSSIQCRATLFIITSNMRPEEWYADMLEKYPHLWPALKRRISHYYHFWEGAPGYGYTQTIGYN